MNEQGNLRSIHSAFVKNKSLSQNLTAKSKARAKQFDWMQPELGAPIATYVQGNNYKLVTVFVTMKT